MTETALPLLSGANVGEYLEAIRLVEVKATKARIRDASLNGFFFGATEREFAMAGALGDRYLFAFVVLGNDNEYGGPFAVLLTLDQLERRIRSRRIQFQVNLRTDMTKLEDMGLVLLEGPGPEPGSA